MKAIPVSSCGSCPCLTFHRTTNGPYAYVCTRQAHGDNAGIILTMTESRNPSSKAQLETIHPSCPLPDADTLGS